MLGDIVHLLDARSAKVDAVSPAGENSGNDLKEFIDRQGPISRLDIREGLSDAELIVVRSTASPIEHWAIIEATNTYSARQAAFLTVG